MYRFVERRENKLLVWLKVSILAVVAFTGGAYIDVACIVTCVRNFPEDRGHVVGENSQLEFYPCHTLQTLMNASTLF